MHCQCSNCDLILTRVCWNGSVGNHALRFHGSSPRNSLEGGLRSGRGDSGPRLSPSEVRYEFHKHSFKLSMENFDETRATALVSVSDRIIDTLSRAISLYQKNVPPEEIHIVFIHIPAAHKEAIVLHSARDIASECDWEGTRKFEHEFLFEWAIPHEYVEHSVTMKTLLSRGLGPLKYLQSGKAKSSTEELKLGLLEALIQGEWDAWDIGLSLGGLAKRFGAKSPFGWIADQLCWDIVGPSRMQYHGLPERGYANLRDGTTTYLGRKDMRWIEDGMDTYLVDWWVTSERFVQEVRQLAV